MNIHSPHPTPAPSTVSFPPFPHPESSALPASPALPSLFSPPPTSVSLRVLCGRSRTLATLATFVANLAVFAAIVATFAATWRWQTQQTRLKSGPESRRHQIRIEKRQKRQCSPRWSTLACVTANRRDVWLGNLVVLIDGWACSVALIGPSVWLFRTPYRLFHIAEFAYLATASLSGMSRPFRLALANLCAQWARASPDFYSTCLYVAFGNDRLG